MIEKEYRETMRSSVRFWSGSSGQSVRWTRCGLMASRAWPSASFDGTMVGESLSAPPAVIFSRSSSAIWRSSWSKANRKDQRRLLRRDCVCSNTESRA